MIEELKEELAQIILKGKEVKPLYKALCGRDPLYVEVCNVKKPVDLCVPDKFIGYTHGLEQAAIKLIFSKDCQDVCYAKSLVKDIATSICVKEAREEILRLEDLWRKLKKYKERSYNKVSKDLYNLANYKIGGSNVEEIMPIVTSLCQVIEDKSLPLKQIQNIINNFLERY